MTMLKTRDTGTLPEDAPYRVEPAHTTSDDVESVSSVELTAMPELADLRRHLADGTVTPAEARRQMSARIPGLADDLKAAKRDLDRRRNQLR